MIELFNGARRSAVALSLLFAVPCAAQSPMPPLEAYGQLPAFEQADLSPAGNVAILGLVNGKRMVLVLDRNMKPLNAVEVGDIKVRNLDWAGDEAVVIMSSHTEKLDVERFLSSKAEIWNALIVPIDSSQPVQRVFADQRKMVKAVFGTYGMRQVGGDWVGFFAGREMAQDQSGYFHYDGAGRSLFQVDVASGKPKKISSPVTESGWGDWLVDAKGKVGATIEWFEQNGLWRIRNGAGDVIATGNEPKGGVGLMSFGETGRSVIYSHDDEGGDAHLYEVPLDGSSAPSEILADVSVYGFYTDPYSGRLMAYRPDDEDADLVFLDPALKAAGEKILAAFRGKKPQIVEWSPDLSRVLVRTRGNGDSGTWYLVAMDSLQASPIGFERPKIGTHVGPISTINYTAQDGTDIEAILTLPPDREAKNLPIVMLPHGGPHSHDIATFDWWAQAFASRGYAVLQPNFRGSTNRDAAFEHAGYGEWGRKMQTDLSDGIGHLAQSGMVDPKRACIVGASYGGYAALAGVTVQNGVYRCAVAVAGVSDLRMMYEREMNERGRARLLKKNLREELGDLDRLGDVSPRRLADKADAPILLIHGRDDTVVDFKQSTVMADALKDAGKPFEMIELVGEDHNLSNGKTRQQMLQSAVAFVQRHNPAE